LASCEEDRLLVSKYPVPVISSSPYLHEFTKGQPVVKGPLGQHGPHDVVPLPARHGDEPVQATSDDEFKEDRRIPREFSPAKDGEYPLLEGLRLWQAHLVDQLEGALRSFEDFRERSRRDMLQHLVGMEEHINRHVAFFDTLRASASVSDKVSCVSETAGSNPIVTPRTTHAHFEASTGHESPVRISATSSVPSSIKPPLHFLPSKSESFCSEVAVSSVSPRRNTVVSIANQPSTKTSIHEPSSGEFVDSTEIEQHGGVPSLRTTMRSITSVFSKFDNFVPQRSGAVSVFTLARGNRKENLAVSVPREVDWKETAMVRVSMCLVILNTIFIGYQVRADLEAAKVDETLGLWVDYVDISFTVAFCIELCVLLRLKGSLFFMGDDRYWNFFEVALITSSVLEWVLHTMDFSFVRSLRIFKAIRVVRVLRVVRFVRELRVMVASVLCSLASLSWAVVFLAFLLYLFSLVILQDVITHFRASANVDPQLVEFYGSLLDSMITLFMAITGGDDWRQLLEPLQKVSWYFYTPFFIFYVAFTVFGVMNILTAIFVEAAGRISNIDRDLVIQEQMAQTDEHANALRKVFHDADVDGTLQLELHTFESHLRDRDVLAYLKFLEIDVYEARELFQLLDVDETGAVDIDEFVIGMMRLKGAAKGVDVANLMYENKKISVRLVAFMKFVEDNFTALGESLDVDMSKLREVSNCQEYVDEEEDRQKFGKKMADHNLIQVHQGKSHVIYDNLARRQGRTWDTLSNGFASLLGKSHTTLAGDDDGN